VRVRPIEAPMKRVDGIEQIVSKEGRGRPQKRKQRERERELDERPLGLMLSI